jgi:hypothetical protein
MTPEVFVQWLRGYIDGTEATHADSWSALEGIKKKLAEVIVLPAAQPTPSLPWTSPGPVWVGGEPSPSWPKVGDIICRTPPFTAQDGTAAQ